MRNVYSFRVIEEPWDLWLGCWSYPTLFRHLGSIVAPRTGSHVSKKLATLVILILTFFSWTFAFLLVSQLTPGPQPRLCFRPAMSYYVLSFLLQLSCLETADRQWWHPGFHGNDSHSVASSKSICLLSIIPNRKMKEFVPIRGKIKWV